MILSALILILLPHQGYWFGGQPQELTVRSAVAGKLPQADLSWSLMFGNIRVGGDTVSIGSNQDAAILKITPPDVRKRTAVSLVYRIRQHGDGKDLGGGELSVQLFPPDPLAGLSERIKGKKLVVWDSTGSLSSVIEHAKVEFIRTKDGSGLKLMRCDVILVDAKVAVPSPFAQEPLLDQVRAGASVMVFAQQEASTTLFGYSLVKRKMPPRLDWRMDHPLFAGLDRADVESWLGASEQALAVRVPADEPALEIAWWPREVPGTEPVSLDALLLSKTIGAGRLVLCQLPLGDWRTDPRSQILLSNSLDYLLTPPERTLRPSERPATQPTVITHDPNRVTLPGE